MNKNCKLTIGAMLLLTTAFSVAEVRAQTCVVPPTCEGLGYDKSASDCGGLAKLRCPFDDSKYFCTAYTDQDGNKLIEVGDIVYSDGSYSSPEALLPSKRPIGVVFNASGGKIIALDTYKNVDYAWNPFCTDYTAEDVGSWSVPTETELKTLYNNKSTVNATLNRLSELEISSCYVHSESYCVDMSNGTSTKYRGSKPVRCINSIANIKTSTLKVGELLYDNGVPVGKIFSLNPNVVIALSSSTTDYQGAQNYCKNMTAGGLNWTLPDGILLEKINATKTYIDGCTHYWSSTRSCFLCGNNNGDCSSGTSPSTAIVLCVAYF